MGSLFFGRVFNSEICLGSECGFVENEEMAAISPIYLSLGNAPMLPTQGVAHALS